MKYLHLKLLLLGLVASGCSQSSSPSPMTIERHTGFERYKVSVLSEGHPVQNYRQALVHRVRISPTDLNVLAASPPSKPNIPFTGELENDLNGRSKGVRLRFDPSNKTLPDFGLHSGDLLTAVNVKHTTALTDVLALVDSLRTDREASVTIERNGSPQKILYYLQ